MTGFRRFFSLALSAVLAAAAVLPASAGEVFYPLTASRSADGSAYLYRLEGTQISFSCTVSNGSYSTQPVELILSAGASLFYQGSRMQEDTVTSDTPPKSVYRFGKAESYSLKIKGSEQKGENPCALFSFTIWSGPHTASPPAAPAAAGSSAGVSVTHSDGAGYYTSVKDGGITAQPVSVTLFGEMLASVSYEGGAWSDYVSGASLSRPGSYEIHFYRKDSDETSDISFTVAQPVSSSEPSRYVDNLIVPQNQIDPDLGNETGPSIGGWSYDDTGTGAGDVHPASGGYTVPLLPTADPSELANPPSGGDSLPSLPAWGADIAGYSPGAYDPSGAISGIYHAEYGLYELSFAGRYFYANIANGDITAGPVTIDLPAGISIEMEKDGLPAAFANNTPILENGSYLLRLQASDSAGTQSTGLFRFRIQPLPAQQEPEQQIGGLAPGEWEAAGLPPEDIQLPPDAAEGGVSDGEETADSPAGEQPEPGAEAEGGAQALTGVAALTGLSEQYDDAAKMFLQTGATGYAFYTGVPNGSLTNGPVTFKFPAAPSDLTVTRDDKPYDYNPGDPIAQNGAYCMTIGRNDLPTLLSGGGVIPQFTFRIVSGAVNDVDFYNPPSGYAISSATLDKAPVAFEPGYLWLSSDGQYEISAVSQTGAPLQSVQILRDTAPPQFTLAGVAQGRATGAAVTVEFLSQDLERVELYDGAKQVRLTGNRITEPGDYRLVARDEAGNRSEQRFVMTYHIDFAGILVVLLVLLLAAGGGVFFLKTRQRLRVR